jgi:predicted kinase
VEVKILYIMRGLPGSGKSTKARALVQGGLVASTDDYFMEGDEYVFDVEKLTEAHDWNLRRVAEAMRLGVGKIACDNTNIEVEHIDPYLKLADRFGYEAGLVEVITSLSDEELAARTIHAVPVEVIASMRKRWEEEYGLREEMKGDPTTCYYCGLKDPKVEAAGVWHCPNKFCSGPGAFAARAAAGYHDEEGRMSEAGVEGYMRDSALAIRDAIAMARAVRRSRRVIAEKVRHGLDSQA